MNPYADAVGLLHAGKKKEGERALLLLLNADSDNPVLMFALGMCYVSMRKTGLALALFRQALPRMEAANDAYVRLGIFPATASEEGKKKFIRQQTAECLGGMGLAHKYEFRTEEAARLFAKAVALAPDDAALHCNAGSMYVNDGRPQEGLHWCERALEIEPYSTEARWNLGLMQLELGRWAEGFKNYDLGSERANGQLNNRLYTYPDGKSVPLWAGETGMKLVAWGEQGIGDEIMFGSCLPDLKAVSKEVILDCHPRLVTLFERSFGLKCHGTRKDDWLEWAMHHTFDARVALGSLPRYFRSNGEFPKLPYLMSGRNETVDAMPGFKIGISWTGGYKETRKAVRSVPLLAFEPILCQDNVSVVSLQYTECSDELDWMQDRLKKPIQRFDFVTDPKSDYDLTAEVVNSCDLIVSVNTSLVHLAGALGTDCWTLTPSKPAWRYGVTGDMMPWYGSVRQYRQGKDETWAPAIRRVADELADFLQPLRVAYG